MQSSPEKMRSILPVALAAVLILQFNFPLVADELSTVEQKSSGTDSREPITYDHVYGSKRISLGGFPSTRVTWIDDDHYIQRVRTNVVQGRQPFRNQILMRRKMIVG